MKHYDITFSGHLYNSKSCFPDSVSFSTRVSADNLEDAITQAKEVMANFQQTKYQVGSIKLTSAKETK